MLAVALACVFFCIYYFYLLLISLHVFVGCCLWVKLHLWASGLLTTQHQWDHENTFLVGCNLLLNNRFKILGFSPDVCRRKYWIIQWHTKCCRKKWGEFSKLQKKRKPLLKWLSHLNSSSPSGPQVPTATVLPVVTVAFASSFSKPLLSSALSQGLLARQQLLPICSQALPLPGRSNRL